MTALDFYLFGGVAGVLIGFGLALVAVYIHRWWQLHKHKALPEPAPILDWRPTLRIDAIADPKAMYGQEDIPAMWVLMVEEKRLMPGIGGDPNVEIRQRYATRREVRNVVSAYHRAMAEDITKRAQSMRTGLIDDDDPLIQAAQDAAIEEQTTRDEIIAATRKLIAEATIDQPVSKSTPQPE